MIVTVFSPAHRNQLLPGQNRIGAVDYMPRAQSRRLLGCFRSSPQQWNTAGEYPTDQLSGGRILLQTMNVKG